MTPTALHLGIDAGGSRTRAVLLDAAGRAVGRGEGPGANPAGAGTAPAAVRLAATASAALGDRPPGAVTACLIGLAGHRALADPAAFADRFRRALRLEAPVLLVPDAVPALGTAAPTGTDGTVLVAGTGAVCVRVAGLRAVAANGGLGWLLGDEGSGWWIGREAVRRAHAQPDGALGSLVRAHCAAGSSDELLRWAYDGPPRGLAALAAPVCRLAATGEPTARAITDTAADHLAALARATARPGQPLVLSGSVATADGPVRTRLLHLLADLDPLLPRTDPATAAARLAANAACHDLPAL
ncbi:N-acetylglucosamine kinase [Kitasatospora phosalacinea]|uniref:N-acetylglucosamine kinase n=1 Tax=Kitasatospora phosalacinea TaxID=2065 RepID=A0A9W6Q733_9ACTN|nr:BadF/BadG/BcrA/BcrD ATPase family protein [Kitasatospora phosalacinea]GLW70979.1 N-acetylglucosamine kinase [Kitasatospora phosalacinea]